MRVARQFLARWRAESHGKSTKEPKRVVPWILMNLAHKNPS